MTQNLLDIGSAVFAGSGQTQSHEQFAKDIVEQALDSSGNALLPVRFALLLATGDWCEAEIPLPRRIRHELQSRLGYEVPLIGGSTDALYCSMANPPRLSQGFVLLLFRTNDTWLSVVSLPNPHSLPAERSDKAKRLAVALEEQAGTRLGIGANRFLLGFLPGVMLDEQGAPAYFDHELHRDLMAAFNSRYLLFGASTKTGAEQVVGYQFANDECLKSGLALALMETDLCLGAAMSHGFSNQARQRVSVDALADADSEESGYVVTKLDGRPVGERLAELKAAGKFKQDRPVFGLPYGADYDIFWPLTPVTGTEQSLRLKRKVTVGDQLYLLDAEPSALLKSAEDTLERAITQSSVTAEELSLLLCFTCGTRVEQYEAQQVAWLKSVNLVRQKYASVPLVGMRTAGEFGLDALHQIRGNNMSFGVICSTNAYSRRASSRNLQRKLVQAASRLLNCHSPREVMRQALRGAVEAGATGGKINMVDQMLGRILGKGVGEALSATGSHHNWEAVAKHTDYQLPPYRGGDFPQVLRQYAMEVVPDLPFQLNFTNTPTQNVPGKEAGQWDDILQMVVRTLHAVFIPDSRDFEQIGLIHSVARAAGQIRSQLVAPLVGSRQKVIATLQLSFPDDEKPLDRESIALWVGYAQRVAVALELAEETEQRESLEQITELGNQLMRAPLGRELDPHAWCHEFISRVAELLGADGGHLRTMRLSDQNVETDEYLLRGAVGMMADILVPTRRKVSVRDGSFRLKLIEAGGKIVNTRAEVVEFNADIKALSFPKRYGTALAERLSEIQATALLPVAERGKVLGSLVLDSRQEYFFTTRRQQLAQAAAIVASSILQAKRTEYFQAKFQRGLEELVNARTDLLRGWIQTEQGTASERLKLLLARVCRITGADVASVFTWHLVPQKLLLHTPHNWHRLPDGKVEYSIGEGWTGNLRWEKEDISILSSNTNEPRAFESKYGENMIPPEHWYGKKYGRIGVQLKSGNQLIGVMTLVYYESNSKMLNERVDARKAFLESVVPLITLSLDTAMRDAREQRTKQFFTTKDEVFDLLIKREWEQALVALRQAFQVEEVSFYHWRNNKLALGWRDSIAKSKIGLPPHEFEPSGALFDLISRRKEVLLLTERDSYLKLWPNWKNIRNLLAVPVITLDGELLGILELINRLPEAEHPYEAFDSLEQALVADIARPFAGAILSDQLRRRLTSASTIGEQEALSAIEMHQLLSPFGKMRVEIEWLRHYPDKTPAERTKHLNRIEAQYSQALATIKHAGRQHIQGIKQANIQQIVQAALDSVGLAALPSEIERHISNTLSVEIKVDPLSFRQALENLFSNAIEAMNGTGILTVTTSLSDNQKDVSVFIRNTCLSPLTKNDLALFDSPGYTTKGDSDAHLGLGIPLAKEVINKANGTLKFSVVVGGVEAVVQLPVIADEKINPQSK